MKKTVNLCSISDSLRRSTGYRFLRLQDTLTVVNFVAFLLAITIERDPSCSCVDLHARGSYYWQRIPDNILGNCFKTFECFDLPRMNVLFQFSLDVLVITIGTGLSRKHFLGSFVFLS